MKKSVSILLSVALILSIISGTVSAAPEGYTVASDLLPAIQAVGTLSTTANWLGTPVSTEGITKTDALAYDFTVEGNESNSGFKIQLDGYSVEAWNLTGAIAEKHGVALAGDKLPAGVYTGVLDVSALPALSTTTAIFGLTKASVTVREFAFVTGSATGGNPGGTTPPPAGGDDEEEGDLVVSGGVALYGTVQDPSEETIATPDATTGAFEVTQSGWKGNIVYYNSGVAAFAAAEGEALYIAYDFTVAADTTLQITLNGWDNHIGVLIAGDATQLNDNGNKVVIPAGTYKGYLPVTKDQIGESGRFGIDGTNVVVRELRLVSAKAGTTPPPSGGTTPPPSGGTTPPPAGGEEDDDDDQGGTTDTVSSGVGLFGTINNADETAAVANGDAATGAFTISGLTGWNPFVAYFSREVAGFEAAAGESLYIAYDFTVAADTTLQIALNGWNNHIGGLIAGDAAQLNDDGEKVIIPAGTYKGYLPVTKDQIGESGRIGIAGTNVVVRELRLVSGVNLDTSAPDNTIPEGGDDNNGTPAVPAGDAAPIAVAGLAVISAAALLFVSRKQK